VSPVGADGPRRLRGQLVTLELVEQLAHAHGRAVLRAVPLGLALQLGLLLLRPLLGLTVILTAHRVRVAPAGDAQAHLVAAAVFPDAAGMLGHGGYSFASRSRTACVMRCWSGMPRFAA
jgi:hypothetical protein